MKTDRVLPLLVYCDAALTILAIALDSAMSWFLPPPLQAYLERESVAHRWTGDLLVTGLWVAVMVATVLAWIGLLNLWRPARAIYFWSWVATLLLLPLEPAWVFSPVGYMLDTAASLVGGALLGVLYFSDARARFERPAAGAPEAGAARV